jgi:hypothetical protein
VGKGSEAGGGVMGMGIRRENGAEGDVTARTGHLAGTRHNPNQQRPISDSTPCSPY